MAERGARADESDEARNPNARLREIYDVAARVFSEKGYDGASIQDVADAVGILKGSLYYYIDTKQDLLYGIIDEVHRDALRALEEWVAVDGDATTRLRAFVEGHVLANTRNITKIGVFFHDFRSLDPERRERIITDRDRYDSHLRGLIREGQVEGVFRADIDPKLASMGILGMMNWTYHWWRDGGPNSAAEVAKQFADLILLGLAGDGTVPHTSPGNNGSSAD
jgi:AcrR family transcriptional regulator